MTTNAEELQCHLDEQKKEIDILKEQAEHQKKEWELKLSEEIYDAKVEKYRKLYKEAFGSDQLALPSFTPTPPVPDIDPQPEQSEYEKKLEKDLENDIPKDLSDPTGDDIPLPMAASLTHWFQTIHSGQEIQDTLKDCVCPQNATALKVVKLNEEVKLQRQDEINNNRMRWLCTAVPKTTQPLVRAWATLSDLEFELQQTQPADSLPLDALVPITEDRQLNLSEVIRDVKHGIKCLEMVRVQCIQKRRLDLHDKLQGAAKELAEPNQPFDDELFGSNMGKRVNKIIAANKVTAKIAPKGLSSFLARGHGKHGGSRGSHFKHRNYRGGYHNYQQYHKQPQWSHNQFLVQQYYPQYPNYPPSQQSPSPQKRGLGRGWGQSMPHHQNAPRQ